MKFYQKLRIPTMYYEKYEISFVRCQFVMNKLKGYGKLLIWTTPFSMKTWMAWYKQNNQKRIEAEKNIFISIHADADFFLVYD